jgi:PAS domain-containing protein
VRILLSAFPPDDRTDLEAEVVDDLRTIGLFCEPGPSGTWVARTASAATSGDAPAFFVTRDEAHLPEVLESGAVDAVVWPRDRAALPYRILNAIRVAEDRAQTSFLRRLLDACPEAILVMNKEGEIVFANERACAIDEELDAVDQIELDDGRTAMFVREDARLSQRRLKAG